MPQSIHSIQSAQDNRQPGWLWVSAGVLAAMIVVQVSGVFESPAYAEMATSNGSYSMMTSDGGNDEILVVVDSRQESLMVYRAQNNMSLQMVDREELSSLFSNARARAMGSP